MISILRSEKIRAEAHSVVPFHVDERVISQHPSIYGRVGKHTTAIHIRGDWRPVFWKQPKPVFSVWETAPAYYTVEPSRITQGLHSGALYLEHDDSGKNADELLFITCCGTDSIYSNQNRIEMVGAEQLLYKRSEDSRVAHAIVKLTDLSGYAYMPVVVDGQNLVEVFSWNFSRTLTLDQFEEYQAKPLVADRWRQVWVD